MSGKTISSESFDTVFYKAHSQHEFLDKPVGMDALAKAIDMAHLAPTAYNCTPMRTVFVQTPQGKERLLKHIHPANLAVAEKAPVIAILAFDECFTEKIPYLMPFVPKAKSMFEATEALLQDAKTRNGHLQAGYLILALRAVGLAVSPMSGFDSESVDQEFLEDLNWKSNFIVCIGYPNPDQKEPIRAPRFEFDDVAAIL